MGTVPGQQGSEVPPGAAPLDVSEEGDDEKIKPVNFKELTQGMVRMGMIVWGRERREPYIDVRA